MIIKNRCQCALSNYNLGKSTRERKFKHKMIFFPVLKPLEIQFETVHFCKTNKIIFQIVYNINFFEKTQISTGLDGKI